MSYRGHSGKTLCVAAIAAVAAMAFIGVASASAAEFHAGSNPARVKATNTNNHVFTAGLIGNISCESATFTGGFVAVPAKTLEVTPAYSKCTFLGVSNVEVKTNGCKYVFKQPEGSGPFTGKVDVVCPEGKTITFGTATCTVTVPGQTGLSKVEYVNTKTTEPWDVDVTANVTGIEYTATGACNGFPGTHKDGVYKGAATAIAENEAEEIVNAWIE
jgi:hypothetical protein